MNNSHLLTFVLVALVSSLPANAWFRVACATQPLVSGAIPCNQYIEMSTHCFELERVDPIISPKSNPSNHVHTIHGASNFAYNSTYETLRASSCTSCLVTQDKSDYWFPKLYFQDPSTKLFEAVPNGGLLVYYQNRGDGDVSNGGPGIKAFPPGFKMVTGNPTARSHV
ncbi:hypothetical protein H0H93_006583 [Arthromyces matolae]|nr:hypothetical protein H0H93_006583 [Arthromyces matolae]